PAGGRFPNPPEDLHTALTPARDDDHRTSTRWSTRSDRHETRILVGVAGADGGPRHDRRLPLVPGRLVCRAGHEAAGRSGAAVLRLRPAPVRLRLLRAVPVLPGHPAARLR